MGTIDITLIGILFIKCEVGIVLGEYVCYLVIAYICTSLLDKHDTC